MSFHSIVFFYFFVFFYTSLHLTFFLLKLNFSFSHRRLAAVNIFTPEFRAKRWLAAKAAAAAAAKAAAVKAKNYDVSYFCELCQKNFAGASGLWYHNKHVHGGGSGGGGGGGGGGTKRPSSGKGSDEYKNGDYERKRRASPAFPKNFTNILQTSLNLVERKRTNFINYK